MNSPQNGLGIRIVIGIKQRPRGNNRPPDASQLPCPCSPGHWLSLPHLAYERHNFVSREVQVNPRDVQRKTRIRHRAHGILRPILRSYTHLALSPCHGQHRVQLLADLVRSKDGHGITSRTVTATRRAALHNPPSSVMRRESSCFCPVVCRMSNKVVWPGLKPHPRRVGYVAHPPRVGPLNRRTPPCWTAASDDGCAENAEQ